MKKPAIVRIAALLFLFSVFGMAQTAKKAPEVKTVKTIEQSDLGKDNAQSKNMTDSQKTLANPDKSTYILESSLPTRTAAAVAVYDFTTGSDKYYGGVAAAKDLGDGNWGMVSGDADGNGQIQIDDKNVYWWIQSGASGYLESDFNLNGQVQIDDKNVYWWYNTGKGSQVP